MSAKHAIVHHNHTRTFEPIGWSDTVGTPEEIIFALGYEKGVELIEKLARFSSWEYRKAHDFDHFKQGVVATGDSTSSAEAMQIEGEGEQPGAGDEKAEGARGKRKADEEPAVEDEVPNRSTENQIDL